MATAPQNAYIVESVVHASQVLRAFASASEALRLRDVVARTGFNKGQCFRMLHTLHHCGLLEKIDVSRYRRTFEISGATAHRVGYAGLTRDGSFPDQVHAGLVEAAHRAHVELIVVDNRYQPKVALRNAERLIREKVDVAIEFQADESAAPSIAAKYREAGIPLIAIDIPHPGATYFGANNYQAGVLAGRHLARWARAQWGGRVDEILLLALARAGSLVHARLSGALSALRESLPDGGASGRVVSLDADGQFAVAVDRVRKHLRETRASHVLVAAANDPSALGAARAFQEAGRGGSCAIVGQGAEPDARVELREARTPLIASVGYFPERYGDGVMKLAVSLLARKPVPPAVFVRHRMVTRENVDQMYPNDQLFGIGAAGS